MCFFRSRPTANTIWPPSRPSAHSSSQFYARQPLPPTANNQAAAAAVHLYGTRKESSNSGIHNTKRKKSSLASRFPQHPAAAQSPSPTLLNAEVLNEKSKYHVVQRLLPDVSLARHIVDSDDHAFASVDECCHDLNNNVPKLTAERRRDHLHLMRRRKSRARLLTNEELLKLTHFRKFIHRAGIGPHALIHKVLDIRRLDRLHAYDEDGIPATKDVIR